MTTKIEWSDIKFSVSSWCNSLVPREQQIKIFDIMARHQNHKCMVLTEDVRALHWLIHDWRSRMYPTPLIKHIWAGVLIHNQEEWDDKKYDLSCIGDLETGVHPFALFDLSGPVDLEGLTNYFDWAIVTADNEDWVRSLRDQIKFPQRNYVKPLGMKKETNFRNIPFFYKGKTIDGEKISLPELDGKVWAEIPD